MAQPAAPLARGFAKGPVTPAQERGPAPVQARVREAALKVVAQWAVKERPQTLGTDPVTPVTPLTPVTPGAMAADLKASREQQGAQLKAIDFKPE